MIHIRFMTVSGKFETAKTAQFSTVAEATAAVEAYAAEHHFTNVKKADEDLGISFRFTARTPGGRGGRNIAYMDFDEE